MTYQEGHVEADGFQVRYRKFDQPQPVGVVVVLDGMTWGPPDLFHALAQQNRVIVMELPGFGAMPANTRSRSVPDLAQTMARASARVVPDKYTLIGTSFGANVAVWQTLMVPGPVEALILVSPTAILPAGGLKLGTPEQLAKQLLAHPENLQALPALDPAVLAQEQELVRRLKVATHDAVLESRLSEIQCATLVVFGSKEKMVAPEAASIYRAKIPNCNVSIVYDTGHLIIAERPEALCSLVSDFVERRETFIVERRTGIINP
jgi:pimeloyl-ACP methyl ester carboxylesterase